MKRVSRNNQLPILLGLTLLVTTLVWAQGAAVKVEITIYPDGSSQGIPRAVAGVIPVAILSHRTFDARTIDAQSLILSGTKAKLMGTTKSPCQERDVNRDGLLDIVCQFWTVPASVQTGAALVVLDGRTTDGIKIRGEAVVHFLPDRIR